MVGNIQRYRAPGIRAVGDDMMQAITATDDVHGELLGEPSPDLRANFADDGLVQLFPRHDSM